MIGLIEANHDNYHLLFSENRSINVGEAFVLPEYRDSKTAHALLAYLEQDLLKKRSNMTGLNMEPQILMHEVFGISILRQWSMSLSEG